MQELTGDGNEKFHSFNEEKAAEMFTGDRSIVQCVLCEQICARYNNNK